MKNLNKTFMVKTMGPLIYSRAPSWLPGPRTDVPTEPPSDRPWQYLIPIHTPTQLFIVY